jgi:hypothetical protein
MLTSSHIRRGNRLRATVASSDPSHAADQHYQGYGQFPAGAGEYGKDRLEEYQG